MPGYGLLDKLALVRARKVGLKVYISFLLFRKLSAPIAKP
jgi:hypothetical protein